MNGKNSSPHTHLSFTHAQELYLLSAALLLRGKNEVWHNNVHLLLTAAAAQVACFGEEVNYYVVHNTRGLTNFHLYTT